MKSTSGKTTLCGTSTHLTTELASEAAAMEARLAELRRTMSKEKTKREATRTVASTSGSIWANAATGSVRRKSTPNAKGIGQRQASTSGNTANNDCISAAHQSAVRRPTRSASDNAMPTCASHTAADASSAAGGVLSNRSLPASQRPTGASAVSITSQGAAQPISSSICNAITTAGVAAAGRTGSSSVIAGQYYEVASCNRLQEASQEWRQAGAKQQVVDSSKLATDKQAPAVTASGASGAHSLLAGGYDETASRDSFLEALKEWRQAGAKPQAQNSTHRQGGITKTAVMDMQTKPPGPRLGSFQQRSSTSAESTGTPAPSIIGSYFQRLLSATGGSSTGSTDSSTSLRAELPPGWLGGEVGGKPAALLQTDVPADSTGPVAATVAEKAGDGVPCAADAASNAASDGAADADDISAAGVQAAPNFEDWLQETEQVAAAVCTLGKHTAAGEQQPPISVVAATSGAKNTGTSALRALQASADGSKDAATGQASSIKQLQAIAAAAPQPAASNYQQQLQQLLGALEQAEEKQSHISRGEDVVSC